jgi:hypothetical protein
MAVRDSNKWYQTIWLPVAAFTYIIICIFDFMIMPIYVTAHNSRIENSVIKDLEGKDAISFADILIKSNQAQRQWNPLTLLGAGMFHLSFGALLTGGAITRGFAKKSEIEGYYRQQPNNMYDPSYQYGNNYPPQNRQPSYQQVPTPYPTQGQYYADNTSTDGPMPKTRGVDDIK